MLTMIIDDKEHDGFPLHLKALSGILLEVHRPAA